jgi:hypothetical protein
MPKTIVAPFFSLIVLLFFVHDINAQSVDSIRAKAVYGFKNKEIKVIAQLDKIDFYEVSFQKKQLKGNPYIMFSTKEYLKGKMIKNEELYPAEIAKRYYKFKNIDSNTKITLTTRPKGDSVTFLYNILGQALPRTYKRLVSNDYSLRDGLLTDEAFKNIALNTTLPVFAYSLPYNDPKQPGISYYCAITKNGVQPDKWWDTYKIPHYIIVEMKIITEERL